jgi:phospholipid/cholesterol/gamma-HCH transport system ATP-binding protein
MRLAKKLADRVMFLHEGRAIFFGPHTAMARCPEPIVQQFLTLDELILPGQEPREKGYPAEA